MKRILDIIRAFCVSPEVACILLLAIGGCVFYDWLADFLPHLFLNQDAFKWVAIVPVAPLALTINERQKLLSPDSRLSSWYLEWPEYHMIKDRYFITLVWEIASICVTVSIWLFGLKITDPLVFILFLGGIIVSIVSYCLLLNATIKLKQLLV